VDSNSASVALLAVKPRFAEAIIAGRKKVEFRKIRFAQTPRYIVLYVSTPIQQIVAFCEVIEIQEHTVIGLWRRHRSRGGIDYRDFVTYYGKRKRGYGIVVGSVWKFHRPASLRDVCPQAVPPQNFLYLNRSSIARLRRRRASCLTKSISSLA
jgi:predicted transcriptional regulator